MIHPGPEKDAWETVPFFVARRVRTGVRGLRRTGDASRKMSWQGSDGSRPET